MEVQQHILKLIQLVIKSILLSCFKLSFLRAFKLTPFTPKIYFLFPKYVCKSLKKIVMGRTNYKNTLPNKNTIQIDYHKITVLLCNELYTTINKIKKSAFLCFVITIFKMF